MAVQREWAPPQQFDEYRLVQPLGHGGMGHVYLAHDTLLDRLVAVKFISGVEPNAESRERFLIEARAAARLQHPNVAAVYRVGELEGRPYILSEFIRGTTLDKLELPVRSWKGALDLGIALARGLAAAHRSGVLHRDIKPSNAILGEDGVVKLLDFGLAKLTDDALPSSAATPPVSHVQKPIRISHAAATLLSRENDHATRKNFAGAEIRSADMTLQSAQLEEPQETRVDQTLRSVAEDPPTGQKVAKKSEAEILIADALTRVGDVMGTPYYMAPEVWRGEPATRRSDVYALGVVLYELCSGFPPHREVRVKELRRVRSESDAPPLAEVAPKVDHRFASVVDRCLKREASERFASGEELLDALEQLVPAATGAAIPEGNPYRGLQSFEAEHRALFFGRSGEMRAVVERLRSESFVLVAGDSGTGKSSLCRAGVLPQIEDGGLQEGRAWSVVRLVPGRRPLASLAAVLAPILKREDEEALAKQIANEPDLVCREARKALGASAGLVIFVDQLEELLTLSAPEDAAATANFFARIAAGVPGVRLLATVRGDFLTRLARLPGLANDLTRALYLLRPLSPDRIREAIVGPAHATGVRFESEALVATLVDSTARTEGGLPLLQFALAELWEARDKAKQSIPSSALDAIGGVAGALARHADGVLASLLPNERAAARRILMRLVTAEGTRARRTEEELVVGDPAARAALDALVRGRLLAAREVEGGTAYEVAHEALLHGWATLREWLDAQAESRVVRQRLEGAAAEWERLGRTGEVLWSARQLAEAALIRREELQPREVEFLRASRNAIRLKKLGRNALILAVPLLVSLVYAGIEFKARRDLDRKVNQHISEAKIALAEARISDEQTEELRSTAFGRYIAGDRPGGDEIWARARAQASETEQTYARSAQALESALVLDGSRKALRALVGDTLYERAMLAEREHNFVQRDELLNRMALYDDTGERRARRNKPATLAITSTPPAAEILAERAVTDHDRVHYEDARPLGNTPLTEVELAPGSYNLLFSAPGRVEVQYPILVRPGEKLDVAIDLPEASAVPKGFAYIPPGRFLYGTSLDDRIRLAFLNTEPVHPLHTGAFLIAQTETTYGDWLEFLKSLPKEQRAVRAPRVGSAGASQSIALQELPDGQWQLSLAPSAHAHVAREGQMIRYTARKRRETQNWLRFPVSGVSPEDIEAYAAWLHSSGRVPGARVCNEREWERAARGADMREYPHGHRLEPDDANFILTYGKDPLAIGPDEVGSHQDSRSPFGVHDMSGNVWEVTRSVGSTTEYVTRGGGYFYGELSGRVTNREIAADTKLRDANLGVRICATWPSR